MDTILRDMLRLTAWTYKVAQMCAFVFHHPLEECGHTSHGLVVSNEKSQWEEFPFERCWLFNYVSLLCIESESFLDFDLTQNEWRGTYFDEGERQFDKDAAINWLWLTVRLKVVLHQDVLDLVLHPWLIRFGWISFWRKGSSWLHLHKLYYQTHGWLVYWQLPPGGEQPYCCPDCPNVSSFTWKLQLSIGYCLGPRRKKNVSVSHGWAKLRKLYLKQLSGQL
jgi:hypothetical protein